MYFVKVRIKTSSSYLFHPYDQCLIIKDANNEIEAMNEAIKFVELGLDYDEQIDRNMSSCKKLEEHDNIIII